MIPFVCNPLVARYIHITSDLHFSCMMFICCCCYLMLMITLCIEMQAICLSFALGFGQMPAINEHKKCNIQEHESVVVRKIEGKMCQVILRLVRTNVIVCAHTQSTPTMSDVTMKFNMLFTIMQKRCMLYE